MAMMKEGWTQVSGTDIYYRKAGDMLEMTRSSPAIVCAVIMMVIFGLLGIGLAASLIINPDYVNAAISLVILFVISPLFAFPWIPCKNHLIIDNASEKLEFQKKNVLGRIISSKIFNMNDVNNILIQVLGGESTAYYLFLLIKHDKIQIASDSRLSVLRRVEELLRSSIKQLKTSTTQLECSDMTLPIQLSSGGSHVQSGSGSSHGQLDNDESRVRSSTKNSTDLEHALVCAIDHMGIEGVVYVCPGCHAMLCNACMSVYISQSLGCPSCGRPVLVSQASDESKLLQIDDRGDR